MYLALSERCPKRGILTAQHRFSSVSFLIILLFRVIYPSWSLCGHKAFQDLHADPSIPALALGRAALEQGRSPGIRGHAELGPPEPGSIHQCIPPPLLNWALFSCQEATLAHEEGSSLGEQCIVQDDEEDSLFQDTRLGPKLQEAPRGCLSCPTCPHCLCSTLNHPLLMRNYPHSLGHGFSFPPCSELRKIFLQYMNNVLKTQAEQSWAMNNCKVQAH